MSIKYIKNTDTVEHTWSGQSIQPSTYYQLDYQEEQKWANNSQLLADIGSGIAVVAKDDSGSNDITDVSSAISYLKNDLVQYDSDGALLSRKKVAPTGWSYHMQGVEFSTSKLNSIVNKDMNGNNLNFANIKLYDVNDNEITDVAGEGLAVKTVIDWEPTFDIELVGGSLKMEQTTTEDIYVYCIGVPDVPVQYGGSKNFISCINMKFINAHDEVKADGRTSKKLLYDAVNHTNKMRLILTHGAGISCTFMMVFEMFRQ